MSYTIEQLLRYLGKGFVRDETFYAVCDIDYAKDEHDCHLVAWRCRMQHDGMVDHPVFGVTSPKDKRIYSPVHGGDGARPQVYFKPDDPTMTEYRA